MSLSLVAYDDSSDSETEENQPSGPNINLDKQSDSKSDVRKLLAVLPPAKRGGGRGRDTKQPVRIGLPKLENESDSDDEEDAPVAKKPRPGKGTSLTALLPEPKGAPTQLGAAKKSTTKLMVPYSLKKKKQEPKKALSKLKRNTSKNDVKNDSDSDGEPVSFFSHLEDSRPPMDTPSSVSGDNDLSNDSKTVPSFPESDSIYPVPDYRTYGEPTSSCPTTDSQSQWYTDQYDAGAQGYPNSEFASQIDYNAQKYASQYDTGAQRYPNSGFAGQTDYNAQGYTSGYAECGSSVQGFTSGYPGQYTDTTAAEGESTAEAMPGPGPGLSIDDEVLRRLAGGSRLRGREKGLHNVIEISEDTVKEGIKVYQKYHTEDSVNKLYQPNLSKVDAPTGMQKRKHQLHYLAHQAKARELELRNHWAQAASTRRQTQMKYGF